MKLHFVKQSGFIWFSWPALNERAIFFMPITIL